MVYTVDLVYNVELVYTVDTGDEEDHYGKHPFESGCHTQGQAQSSADPVGTDWYIPVGNQPDMGRVSKRYLPI